VTGKNACRTEIKRLKGTGKNTCRTEIKRLKETGKNACRTGMSGRPAHLDLFSGNSPLKTLPPNWFKKRKLLSVAAISLFVIIFLIGLAKDWSLHPAGLEGNRSGQTTGIHRSQVTSSALLSVGYDNKSSTLEIEFHNHSIYRYYDVPESVYNELMQASSPGKYFNNKIKGVYRYERIKN